MQSRCIITGWEPWGAGPAVLTGFPRLTGCRACFAKRQKLRAGVSSYSLPFLTLRMPTPCNKRVKMVSTNKTRPPLAAHSRGNCPGTHCTAVAPGGAFLPDSSMNLQKSRYSVTEKWVNSPIDPVNGYTYNGIVKMTQRNAHKSLSYLKIGRPL